MFARSRLSDWSTRQVLSVCYYSHLPVHLLRRIPLEAWVWMVGLLAVACADPVTDGLIALCPSRTLFDVRCPGCGLGHAVGYLVRGEWTLSWQTHPLALPAVALLGGRVAILVRTAFTAPARHSPV